MDILIKRKHTENVEEEVDVVGACRDRAAEHMQKHLSKPLRKASEFPAYEGKPIDLWEAKLLLEIAQLFQETE